MTVLDPSAAIASVSPRNVRAWLSDGDEIALLDVREEGQFGLGHPLLASNIPFSRLEADIGAKVPRQTTRIVLVDAGDGIGARALGRLRALGYSNVSLLEGGAPGWAAAGFDLFDGVNVPSKGFAEVVEVEAHTPHIEAGELQRLRTENVDLVVLDTRTPEEFARFHVPSARSAPGVELVANAADLVPSADTLIVVSCAGRTRSIIGAQGLINFGVPNRVVSLAGGTQGWRLAGFDLEHGASEQLSAGNGTSSSDRLERAADLRSRHGIELVPPTKIEAWRQDSSRTTFLFDVRTRAEFERGHLPGAVWVPGGQLVQTLDEWAAVRGARLVVSDDDGVRASVAAHWLAQLGWEVSVCAADLRDLASTETTLYRADADLRIGLDEAVAWIREEVPVVSADRSANFLAGHVRGAHWLNRARLSVLPAAVRRSRRILVMGQDPALSDLLAKDLAEATGAEVRVLDATPDLLRGAGLTIETGGLEDADRIDTLFWNHRRHEGDMAAMRAYLDWEIELPARIQADGGARFMLGR